MEHITKDQLLAVLYRLRTLSNEQSGACLDHGDMMGYRYWYHIALTITDTLNQTKY